MSKLVYVAEIIFPSDDADEYVIEKMESIARLNGIEIRIVDDHYIEV